MASQRPRWAGGSWGWREATLQVDRGWEESEFSCISQVLPQVLQVLEMEGRGAGRQLRGSSPEATEVFGGRSQREAKSHVTLSRYLLTSRPSFPKRKWLKACHSVAIPSTTHQVQKHDFPELHNVLLLQCTQASGLFRQSESCWAIVRGHVRTQTKPVHWTGWQLSASVRTRRLQKRWMCPVTWTSANWQTLGYSRTCQCASL